MESPLKICNPAQLLVTFEDGTDVPNGKVALTHELSEANFQEHHGRAPGGDKEEVGDEEGPSPVLVAEVREPPDVAEAHGEPDERQEELESLAPDLPLGAAGDDGLRGRQFGSARRLHFGRVSIADWANERPTTERTNGQPSERALSVSSGLLAFPRARGGD